VSQLNALQSNAQTILQLREKRQDMLNVNLNETKFYLGALGITVSCFCGVLKCHFQDDKLDALNIIHVSGTKGKGSTCAFTESILRELGLRTGFYRSELVEIHFECFMFSSPHLVHVRERIRINGAPIAKEMFAERFFKVYDKIHLAVSICVGVLCN
jgi:folylpolyglutamate synthase